MRLAAVAIVLLALWPIHGTAAEQDYPLVNGHFYTQANGRQPGESATGFLVSDDDGIPFWSTFNRLGGTDVLGFPISRRFMWDGLICQATQRFVLQWHSSSGEVRLVNTMDHLTKFERDPMLAQLRLVPRPTDVPAGEKSEHAVPTRMGWLNASAAILRRYASAAEPMFTFGLPTSKPTDVGPAIAMRFQRTVLLQWKSDQPWAKAGDVTIANAGDFLKEAGLIPAEALAPEPAPAMRDRLTTTRGAPRAESRVSGVATWYGAYFHGRIMANGFPYNMWNPRLAASNMFPFGTRLKVTRVVTGNSIVVVVSDRGAFRYPIVVDLSHAAFASLADPNEGVIRVIAEPLD